MEISEILALPAPDMLSELSTHLDARSGGGEYLSKLNTWERTVFYIDELSVEVNSGGFSHYLYYHGHHFEKAKRALDSIAASGAVSLLDQIENAFPGKKLPKTLNAIQTSLEIMEDAGRNFEEEDEAYYQTVEHELLEKLHQYVLRNKVHFR